MTHGLRGSVPARPPPPSYLEPLSSEADCEEDAEGEAEVAAALHGGVERWGTGYSCALNFKRNM